MQYINPIEILGLLKSVDTSSLDIEIIKKAKRKLLADIDLSDSGFFDYHGLQLSKGECENVIDQLSNNELKGFYFYLTTYNNLNLFLVNGNDAIFSDLNQEGVFKSAEFIRFISPYFAPRFDRALQESFEIEEIGKTKAILKTMFLISQTEINIAFRSISNILQDRILDVVEIRRDIKNGLNVYDENNIDEVVKLVVKRFPSATLNCLPNYFQSQILKIANEINYLSVAIWDHFDNSQVCNDLLEHILTLNISGLEKPTFQKNYEIVKLKNNERIGQKNSSLVLKKYAEYSIQSKIKIWEVKTKTTTPEILLGWVNSSISILEINKLNVDFDEIRDQVASSLASMSLEVWNSFSNLEISIELINRASNILELKYETRQNIEKIKTKFIEIRAKILRTNNIRQKTAIKPKPISIGIWSTTRKFLAHNTGFLWFIGLVVVIGVVIWANLAMPSTTDTDNYAKPTAFVDTTTIDTSSVQSSSTVLPIEYAPPIESRYKGNQLGNGASPLTNCFGKGIYSGNAKLTIKNGGDYDAIVCLFSVAKERTIRNEYVRKNSSFTMSKIARGDYKIRVFYGNDWNPNLPNSCGTVGNFETDVNFSEFDGTEYFEDSSRGSTIATLTLYKVQDGNASSSQIDQSQFFKK